MLKNIQKSLSSEIRSHLGVYLLLTAILILAFFVRVYRVGDLLQFYYDQGRDALVIWRLWHEGRPFLIGPITGLAGIFLGPFYYYLIAPFYLIGGGNPFYPAVFLAFLSTLAVIVLYLLGWKMHSRAAGIIAAVIASFSYFIVLASRWLANPTPILLTSVLLLWFMWRIVEKSKNMISGTKSQRFGEWIAITALVGLSLQFESASAVFYIPIIGLFAIWQRKYLPSVKIATISIFVFLATLLPQILFNFRHDNILFDNFRKLFFEERAFKATTKLIWEVRSRYFLSVFSMKLFPSWARYSHLFIILVGTVLLAARKQFKKGLLPLFLLFLATPMAGYLLFQGNYGNIFDYYMTGYYLPFILLFAIGLGEIWKRPAGKLAVVGFFFLFLQTNGMLLRNYLTAGVRDRPLSIKDQLQSVNWVFDDAKDIGEFNVEVYVPPVIPHAYDYLFLWQGSKRCGDTQCGLVRDRQIPVVYTMYERDDPHYERLEAWLASQKGIGEVEEEVNFGDITVQRRKRINN